LGSGVRVSTSILKSRCLSSILGFGKASYVHLQVRIWNCNNNSARWTGFSAFVLKQKPVGVRDKRNAERKLKILLAITAVLFTLATVVGADNPAAAGNAEAKCKFYKTKAVKTGSPTWWHRYYACLAKNR